MRAEIDLLTEPVDITNGARPVVVGIEIKRPWGWYSLKPKPLLQGWYELKIAADNGLTVQLYDQEHVCQIELRAGRSDPVYIKLLSGTYEIRVIGGGRPAVYGVNSASLKPLSSWQHYRLLLNRLFQALRQGVSFGRIADLIRLALVKNRTYGLRAQAKPETYHLGPHARYDLAQRGLKPDPSLYTDRLAALEPGPVFLIKGFGHEDLESQIYTRFVRDETVHHDAVVVLRGDDRLAPDALLLFAEALAADRSKTLFLADKWVRDVPTAHVAWDPILYNGGLPTPYAYRVGARKPLMRFDNQAQCGIISVPVASSDKPEIYREYPHPDDIWDNGRPACSIIIPTRDRADLLSACLAGLFENTPWPHEVIVVDNGSVEPETFEIFEAYAPKGLRVIRADMPFNFSTLCNLGAAAAQHDYLVFLNNDILLHQPDWLERMMAFAVMPEIGSVGAKLLYADGRLQHGGVMMGLTQICGHLWRGSDERAQAENPQLRLSSLRSAVTGACLCVAKSKFSRVGGFDEQAFPVTLNDIDMCLKLTAQGWYNVYTAGAHAIHAEGASRGEDMSEAKRLRRKAEVRAFHARWGEATRQDRWVSPAWSLADEGASRR